MADEILSARTANSKTYELGNRRKRLSLRLDPIHVPTDFQAWQSGQPVNWLEIENSFVETADAWVLALRSWYGLSVPKNAIGYDYTSRLIGGTVSVRLSALDGVRVGRVPNIRFDGADVWWDHVAPDLDIRLMVQPGHVELFKWLRSATAPRWLRWEVTEPISRTLALKTRTFGHDNADWTEPSRIGLKPGRRRRDVILTHATTPDDGTVPGSVHFFFDETWTGQTIALSPDPELIPTPSDEVVYPVLIDTTVNETIAAIGDDGHEFNSDRTWHTQQGSLGTHMIYANGTKFHPGYRFTTVAIPQAATINSASFGFNITGSGGAAGSGMRLYGKAADNASAWADSAGPIDMTPTSASVSFTPWGGSASGTKSLDVTTIVQEIVNRAGWVSGNAMAFGVQGTLTGGGYSYISDLDGGASNIATLTIDYTSGPPESVTTKPAYGEFPKFLLRRAS